VRTELALGHLTKATTMSLDPARVRLSIVRWRRNDAHLLTSKLAQLPAHVSDIGDIRHAWDRFQHRSRIIDRGEFTSGQFRSNPAAIEADSTSADVFTIFLVFNAILDSSLDRLWTVLFPVLLGFLVHGRLLDSLLHSLATGTHLGTETSIVGEVVIQLGRMKSSILLFVVVWHRSSVLFSLMVIEVATTIVVDRVHLVTCRVVFG